MGGMLIVGAGECGARAAFALREAGYDGDVILIGAEPGLPYERPPLSKPAAGGAERKTICDAERFAADRIDYRPGVSVTAVDVGARSARLEDGSSLGYERLLLATGAAPRRLGCAGAERAHLFRTIDDAEAVYAAAGPGVRVAIIGAGLIGMELAACLSARGTEVAVIEATPRPLGRAVPGPLAARLLARHEAAGVRLEFGAAVERIDDGAVVLASGAKVQADAVIVAVGVAPDTALAEAAGLAVANGVLVDDRLRTSAEHVFAAGDCACIDRGDGRPMRYETWRNAQAQGETAALNMLGRDQAFTTPPWFWSDQYELGLQVVGLCSDDLTVARRALSEEAEILFYLDAEGRLAAAAGLGPGNAVARDIRLAEMLIDAGARPSPGELQDPSVALKALLKAARAA